MEVGLMKKYFLTLLMFKLIAGGVLFADNSRGGDYWNANRSDPEKALKEVLDAIKNNDYFDLYGLVSMDVISSLNDSITRYEPKIWGVKINLADILVSEYGLRYGKIAVFEEYFLEKNSMSQSWVHYLQENDIMRKQDQLLVEKIVHEDGEDFAIVTIDEITFIFVYSEGGWFLDNVKYGPLRWREDAGPL
jgi:hypothetical protein